MLWCQRNKASVVPSDDYQWSLLRGSLLYLSGSQKWASSQGCGLAWHSALLYIVLSVVQLAQSCMLQHYTMLHHAELCCAIMHHTALHHTALHYAVQCSQVQ